MKAFEITFEGFDGSSDKTDHLIKWVWLKEDIVSKAVELCNRIGASIEPLSFHMDTGFDATITTHKELLKFLSKSK